MKKLWVAAPAVIAAPLVLAVCVSAASTPSPALALSRNAPAKSKFEQPLGVSAASVTPTWATVRFVLPAADQGAVSEEVVVYPANRWGAKPVFSGAVAGSPVTVTGLKPSTAYFADVSVNGVPGHAASGWAASPAFKTPKGPAVPVPAASPTTPTSSPATAPASATSTPAPAPTSGTSAPTTWPTGTATSPVAGPTSPTSTATAAPTSPATSADPFPTSTFSTAPATPLPSPTSTATGSDPGTSGAVPYAPALSAYTTVTQSYSASDIVNDGWAQDANDTNEGGATCPVADTTYSAALDAVVMTTAGQPAGSGDNTNCGHIRSQYTVPTSGDVVEAKIWLPSLTAPASFGGTSYPAGTLLDWASMWTDGADGANGTENWPADTEVDAVETQYGANYVSVHSGSVNASGGSTGDWTTEPQGWEPAGTLYAATDAGVPNVQGGWNVVDIEFTAGDADIYFNGELFVTIPASQLTHDPTYLNFGISGPNAYDSNNPMWPSGPATEDVQYVKVFS